MELACACTERFPVLGTGLASTLARGKRASSIGEEKRRMVFKPTVPGRRSNDNRLSSYLCMVQQPTFHTRDGSTHVSDSLLLNILT